MADSIKISVDGVEGLQRKFSSLKENTRKKIGRKAVNAAGTPVVKASRAGSPVRYGFLKKDLTKKVIRYGDNFVCVIGVKKNNRRNVGGKTINPSKYVHLLILGTRRGVKANPFLERALKQNSYTSTQIVISKFKEEIDKEWEKQ